MQENRIACARCGFAYNLAREPLCRNCGQPLTSASSAAGCISPAAGRCTSDGVCCARCATAARRGLSHGSLSASAESPGAVCGAAQEVKRLACRAHCSHGRGRRSGVSCLLRVGFMTAYNFIRSGPTTPVSLIGKLTPYLPLNEQRVIPCANPTCLVKVELDTITLFHASHPQSYWAFTITASQYCTGLYLKESSLKSCQGVTFPGIREKWPQNGV